MSYRSELEPTFGLRTQAVVVGHHFVGHDEVGIDERPQGEIFTQQVVEKLFLLLAQLNLSVPRQLGIAFSIDLQHFQLVRLQPFRSERRGEASPAIVAQHPPHFAFEVLT